MLTSLIGKAQCPAPSDLILSQQITMAELSWTKNGTATKWDIAIIPDFYVGLPAPSDVLYNVSSNPFTISGLPPAYGCYAFFVRSWCSPTDVSPWMAVGSLGCSSNVYNYLATLSNERYSPNTNEFQIFPNPATTNVQIKSTSKIRNIRIFDALGKLMVAQQNIDDVNVENLEKGIYFIEASTENGVVYKKLVKE